MSEGINWDNEDLMTTEEVSALLFLAKGTLRNWRARRQNLPFIRAGRRVFYRRADVLAFQNQRSAYLRVATMTGCFISPNAAAQAEYVEVKP